MKQEKIDYNYIVYEIINLKNDMVYVGVHITKDLNDSYLGSGLNLTKAIKTFGKENFKRKILYIFDNAEDMLSIEKEIVNDSFIKRNDTYNIALGGAFNRKGFLTVIDENGNTCTIIAEEYKKSKKYTSVLKNKVTVVDKKGNTFQCDINDANYLNGAYVPINKNRKKYYDPKTLECFFVYEKNKKSHWIAGVPKEIRDVSGEKNPMFNKTNEQVWRGKYDDKEVERRIKQKSKKLSLATKGIKRPEASIKLSGSGNPMYGRSPYTVWLEKYGLEEANRRKIEMNKKQGSKKNE
jgi:hypothetical protein